MSTIHNNATKEQISRLVLLTGDPLRSKYFAEKFLENYQLVNNVRGINGYTGTYKGKKITIMAHGMGVGSMGIYSYELFDRNIYNVDVIIRIGSCGVIAGAYKLGDVAVVAENYSNSTYGDMLGIKKKTIFTSQKMVELSEIASNKTNIPIFKVKNFTTDNFYSIYNLKELEAITCCNTVEMESFALNINALYHGKDALTILTISDADDKSKTNKEQSEKSPTKESLTSNERETGLDNMFLLAAEILLNY